MYLVKEDFTDIQKKFYFNEYGIFYEGQELENFDYQGNYIQNVVINNLLFIIIKKLKNHICVLIYDRIGQKHNYTFKCEGRLGITYRYIK